ncbi:DnaB-like helicase C-terminal domain-containing protein [Streptomyces sp. NPDC102441]|uniref:DnaB-like helicase C-terminal domain-containing protein n=1 Tax=Streptomyces sp. NPDC102441 TaxID=3366176 RepID=UPI00381A9BB4
MSPLHRPPPGAWRAPVSMSGEVMASVPAPEPEASGTDAASSSPGPAEELQVSTARVRLYELVKLAQEDRTVTVVAKRARGHLFRAALIPISLLDASAQARLQTWPSWLRTAARPKLGDLVRDAAGDGRTPGVPQVILDRADSTPLAVLVDAQLVSPDGAPVVVPQHPEADQTQRPAAPQQVSLPVRDAAHHRDQSGVSLLADQQPGDAERSVASVAGAVVTAQGAGTPAPALATGGSAGKRQLAAFGDVLEEVLASRQPESHPQDAAKFGLTALDEAVGGLLPGKLTLVAGAPNAGASLLPAAAARHTALHRQLPVLYAASGLTRTDVAMRVIAAEGPVHYRRLRLNQLTDQEQQTAAEVAAKLQELAGTVWHIDDGTGLRAADISEAARDIEGLALIVVDRLQRVPDPLVPLSGSDLPAAAQALAQLARVLRVPVVAAVDTDEADLLTALDADVTLTVTRQDERAEVTYAERDFGTLSTVTLRADLACARFTDALAEAEGAPKAAPSAGATAQILAPAADASASTALDDGEEADLLAAAKPFTSGASTGISARLNGVLAAFAQARAASDGQDLEGLRQTVADLAARGPRMPETDEGQRLGTALAAFGMSRRSTTPAGPQAPADITPAAAPAPAASATVTERAEPQPAAESTAEDEDVSEAFQDNTVPPEDSGNVKRGRTYTFFTNKIEAAVDQALQETGGDIDEAVKLLKRKAVPDAMALFKLSRVGATYEHSVYPEPLEFLSKPSQKESDQIWEGRHKWRNNALRTAVKKGLQAPLDVTALDTNCAYLSAFKTYLPIGALRHHTRGFLPKESGVHRVDHFEWPHEDVPSPLGGRVEPGPYLLDEATLRLLIRCHELGLSEPPRILESWTSGGTEALLEKFRRILNEARTKAVQSNDKATEEYVKAMYSRFTSTIGESGKNQELRRADWVHIIRSQAFASLFLKAHRAHHEGLILVQVSGVDELHLCGDWQQIWKEGRMPGEIKKKRLYTLGGN